MKKEICDILVIGSGMGGMTSAALLAKAGFRVQWSVDAGLDTAGRGHPGYTDRRRIPHHRS